MTASRGRDETLGVGPGGEGLAFPGALPGLDEVGGQAGQAEDGSRPKFVTEEVGVGGWWWHLLVRAEDAARTPVQSEPFRWRCTRPIPSPPARRRRPKTGEWAGL